MDAVAITVLHVSIETGSQALQEAYSPTTVPGTTATALTTKLFNKLSSAASAGDAAKMQALLAPLDPRKTPQQAGKNLGGNPATKQPGTIYKALPSGSE